MKSVSFTSAGRRELNKLVPAVREQVDAAITLYAETGRGDVKKLKGGLGYRLRTGDFRILFIQTAATMDVLSVTDRKDAY